MRAAAAFAAAVFAGGCHYYYMVKAELQQTNEMFVRPFISRSVMTWNVNAALGTDGVRSVERVADVVKRVDADVVAMQEIDRRTRRAGGVDQMEELERLTGLRSVWCRIGDRDDGDVGMAFLVKDAPAKTANVDLPGGGRAVVLEYPAFTVGMARFPEKDADREAAVAKLAGMVEQARPFMLVGDWGEEPSSAFVHRVRRSFAVISGFSPTYPADGPVSCLDYVAVSRRHLAHWEHVTYKVLDEPLASDHRPLLVKVR
jgi:endonuclease/exonuclease/phosphatase family metal-dependent hydrolase